MAADKQVAAATAATGIPAALNMSGFTNTMYAMVRNVVAPGKNLGAPRGSPLLDRNVRSR